MTQSSIAVSADGSSWAVLNASPDIRSQLQATTRLHPAGLRNSPVRAVVITNADVDHIAGLLTLRERTGFSLYATGDILGTLAANPIFGVMDPVLVERRGIALDQPFEPVPGLRITPFAVPGKVALFLEDDNLCLEEIGEQTIGLMIEDGLNSAAYVPGCAALPDWLLDRLAPANLLLFDGTVWQNDDMQRTGTGEKTGARMGHVPMQGDMGSLARLAGLQSRKIYIHINNTNPVLQPDGPERTTLSAAGWEVARDGLEITL